MKNLKMFNQNNIPESLSNLHFKKGKCVVDLQDVVEECAGADYFCKRVNELLEFQKFKVEKNTGDYVRLLYIDTLGNRLYLKAYKG